MVSHTKYHSQHFYSSTLRARGITCVGGGGLYEAAGGVVVPLACLHRPESPSLSQYPPPPFHRVPSGSARLPGGLKSRLLTLVASRDSHTLAIGP